MSKTNLKALAQDSPIGRIFDFSDRIPPMLVKETRQGLRSAAFTILFLAIQAILSVSILINLTLGSNASSSTLSYLIFLAFIVAVCIVQPIRASNAVNAEVKANTIDLISITNLSSWRIVQGKWISLMAQSMLFAVSLLPYLILRYFLGEMQLFVELILFLVVFVLGGVLTALTLGLSSLSNVFLRFISVAGLLAPAGIFLLSMCGFFFTSDGVVDFVSEILDEPEFLWILIGILLGLSYFGWVALDFAASSIAPLSENRAITRRIFMLGVLIFIVIVGSIVMELARGGSGVDEEVIFFFFTLYSVFIFIPTMIITLTESPFVAPSVVRNFITRRKLGGLRSLFYPGWPSGSLFVLLGIIIIGAFIGLNAIFYLNPPSSGPSRYLLFDTEEFLVLTAIVIAILNFVLFPAAAIALFCPNVRYRLVAWISAFAIIVILGIMMSILGHGLRSEGLLTLFAWLPPVGLSRLSDYRLDKTFIDCVLPGLITMIISLFILLMRGGTHLRSIRAQEKSIRNEATVGEVVDPEVA